MELKIADKNSLRKIKRLYKKAFPRCERCPFRILLNQRKNGTGEFFALVDGENFVGFTIMAFYEELVLLNYFAVEENQRGKGAGTKALELLKEKYSGKRLFLETELPDESEANNVQRLRRYAFYERCGFKPSGKPVSVFSNRFQLMTDNCEISFEEYERMLVGVFGRIMAGNVKEIGA